MRHNPESDDLGQPKTYEERRERRERTLRELDELEVEVVRLLARYATSTAGSKDAMGP
jgi:hypothetical protein